jgi:hypothetical protein
MRFKTLDNPDWNPKARNKILTVGYIGINTVSNENYYNGVEYNASFYKGDIDLVTTRELNRKMIYEQFESSSKEEYIILDQNESICSEINSLKLAEEFVNESLKKCSDNTFTIYKKIKIGKAKVNVETEWE